MPELELHHRVGIAVIVGFIIYVGWGMYPAAIFLTGFAIWEVFQALTA
ncbi:MAG: hypothetical protein V4697_02525 [Patescibacteria group bacterium]